MRYRKRRRERYRGKGTGPLLVCKWLILRNHGRPAGPLRLGPCLGRAPRFLPPVPLWRAWAMPPLDQQLSRQKVSGTFFIRSPLKGRRRGRIDSGHGGSGTPPRWADVADRREGTDARVGAAILTVFQAGPLDSSMTLRHRRRSPVLLSSRLVLNKTAPQHFQRLQAFPSVPWVSNRAHATF